MKHQIIRGAQWTTLSTIVMAVVQILKFSILTHFLSAADYGLMAVVGLVLGFTAIFADLGLPIALFHQQKVEKNYLSSLFWLYLLLAVVLYGFLLALTPVVAWYYQQEALKQLIPWMGLDLILMASGRLMGVMRQKKMEFRFVACSNIVSTLLSLGLAVFLAWRGFGVYSLVFSALAASAIQAILLLSTGLRRFPIAWHFKWNDLGDSLRIGLFDMGSSTLNYIASQMDVFLIGRFFGMEVLGLYNLAKQLAWRPYQMLRTVVSNVTLPLFADRQDDKPQIRSLVIRFNRILASLVWPFFGFVACFAPWIVGFLYADGYAAAAPLLSLLCLWSLFSSLSEPASAALTALGRTDRLFGWMGLRVALSTLAIVLAAQKSIEAVAWSQGIVALILLLVFRWKTIRNDLPMSASAFFGPMLNPIWWTALALIGACLIAFVPGQSSAYWGFSIAALSFVLVYLGFARRSIKNGDFQSL